ncbi:uncharacterized protein LOC128221329 isoform X2 [Mya arenaria]|uniref:uncharacterized protein LOC128221329 isoform X2 n=1 Tax=Mya arenaria TaxID=6604 RepID=UPI0022E526CC|nr:uncharacterized protein LOC128221329 isoform X2 [Mya arenaria]
MTSGKQRSLSDKDLSELSDGDKPKMSDKREILLDEPKWRWLSEEEKQNKKHLQWMQKIIVSPEETIHNLELKNWRLEAHIRQLTCENSRLEDDNSKMKELHQSKEGVVLRHEETVQILQNENLR